MAVTNRHLISSEPFGQVNYRFKNKQVVSSEQEMLLYNIGRLNRKQPPHFMMLSSVSQSRTFSAGTSFEWMSNPSIWTAGPFTAGAVENPTITFVPIQGSDFAQRFESPLADKFSLFLEDRRWSPALEEKKAIAMLMVRSLNLLHGDITNHRSCAAGILVKAPDKPDSSTPVFWEGNRPEWERLLYRLPKGYQWKVYKFNKNYSKSRNVYVPAPDGYELDRDDNGKLKRENGHCVLVKSGKPGRHFAYGTRTKDSWTSISYINCPWWTRRSWLLELRRSRLANRGCRVRTGAPSDFIARRRYASALPALSLSASDRSGARPPCI